MGSLFIGLLYPAEHPGSGVQAESSPGLEAMGAGTQSESQSVVYGVLGVTAESGETPNYVGEVGVSFPVECT